MGVPQLFEVCILVVLLGVTACSGAYHASYLPSFPSQVQLRAGILTKTVPLAFVDESAAFKDEPFPTFRGFQPDLLRELQRIALELHNVTLSFVITEAPPYSYLESFDLLADDCNTTDNPHPMDECLKHEFLVGDYYAYYPRPLRAPFSPALLTTSAAAIKYVHRKKRDIATLAEASRGADLYGYRTEFIELVRKAKRLSQSVSLQTY